VEVAVSENDLCEIFISSMSTPPLQPFYARIFETGEKIRVDRMQALGYRLTGRFLSIGPALKLFELLPLRSDTPADVCLLAVDRIRGVLVADPFRDHKTRLAASNAAPQQKINPHADQGHRQELGSALPKPNGSADGLKRWAIE
jgi:hypothetical protein